MASPAQTVGGNRAGSVSSERSAEIAAEALRLHARYRGKIEILPKCPIRGPEDLAIWYTPGVAAPASAIHARPELVFEHTNRGNLVAIVSDGTRVLGLGDVGPEAALPVMEGKALLFKYFGGVDAVPLCIRTREPDALLGLLELVEPSFGAVNLEDIAQPKCFRVLEDARQRLSIPVWHDDQQGTATVVVAALTNALEVVGKQPANVRIALIGTGAAGVASYRLLRRAGIDAAAFVVCDSHGILHRGRSDIERRHDELCEKWQICSETNPDGLQGGIAEALRGADVCIAFAKSEAGLIRPGWVAQMARDPVVFACANPTPEIWPDDARRVGARVVATGRSDFPNQLNNSLAFPGIFRGVLDVRASAITEDMALAAAGELARFAREQGLRQDRILPPMDAVESHVRVAAATALAAQEHGLARIQRSREQLIRGAEVAIRRTRERIQLLIRAGVPQEP